MVRFVSLCVVLLLAVACNAESPSILFAHGNPGDPCPCAEGLVCMDGICYSMRGEGALCSDQSPPCLSPLLCLNGICTKPGGVDGDSDSDSGHENVCLGSCNSTLDKTRCVDEAQNLCICVTGDWTYVSCSSYCAKQGKQPTGCRYDGGLRMDYCQCETPAVPDGDPEPDLPQTCQGSCSGQGAEVNHCVDNSQDLCICASNSWMQIDCRASCAGRNLESTGCGYKTGQSLPDCQCQEAVDGDPDFPQACQGSCSGQGAEINHCIDNDRNLCICLNHSWMQVDCPASCASRGMESIGCAWGSGQSSPDCQCQNMTDGDSDPACVSDDPDVGRYGQACPYPVASNGVLNAGCGQCQNGLVCMGLYLNDQSGGQSLACVADEDCKTDLGAFGVCVGGYCGLSFCNKEGTCASDSDCTEIGEGACCYTNDGATTGQCLPFDFCPSPESMRQQPGQPCKFIDGLNEEFGGCAENGYCLGAVYNDNTSGSPKIPCKTRSDCAQYGLNSEVVGCTDSGFCGLSFCSIDVGADCSANVENVQGASAICETLPHMNSERWGRACCQIVSGMKLCLPDSVCAQEGPAQAGQACKDPTTQINMDHEFCTSDLSCVAFPTVNMSCRSKADCQSLGSEISDCVNGVCAISFCTKLSCTPSQCSAADYGAGSCCTSEIFADGTSLCAPATLCQR